MAVTWIDMSVLTVLFGLGGFIISQGLSYLSRRDAQEVTRTRQDACLRHEWIKGESAGLRCQLCGKVPG